MRVAPLLQRYPDLRIDYLLTWSCTHIANAATRGIIEETCREAGYEPPTICTPEELTED